LTKNCISRSLENSRINSLIVPKKYVEFLGFYDNNGKVKNRYGNDNKILFWINSSKRIEVANRHHVKDTRFNGIIDDTHAMTKRTKYSFAVIIPLRVMDSLKKMNIITQQFNICTNNYGHLELKPLK
jgi:hypothetical protein